ncbi:hypothetical protein QQ045_022517 [Rhodiola kirilowii]
MRRRERIFGQRTFNRPRNKKSLRSRLPVPRFQSQLVATCRSSRLCFMGLILGRSPNLLGHILIRTLRKLHFRDQIVDMTCHLRGSTITYKYKDTFQLTTHHPTTKSSKCSSTCRRATLSITIILLCSLVLFSCGTFVLSRTAPQEDLEMMQMYEDWMVKHGRVYNSLGKKERRFEILKDNVEGRNYDLAVNKFADLTYEEFEAKYTGYRPRPMAHDKSNESDQKLELVVDVPDSIDRRKKGDVGPVKDHGFCDTPHLHESSTTQDLTRKNHPLTRVNKANVTRREMLRFSITGFKKVPTNNEKALKAAVAKHHVAVSIFMLVRTL